MVIFGRMLRGNHCCFGEATHGILTNRPRKFSKIWTADGKRYSHGWLGALHQGKSFFVPSHQRDFSWTDTNVTTFLSDIEDALSKKNQIYFCGLTVFTKSQESLLKVLDGQQRLATSIMIFSAIRNWLKKYPKFAKDEIRIETQLLQTDDIGADKAEPKLTLTPANNTIFQEYVTNHALVDSIKTKMESLPSEDRNKTLLKAALLVNRHVEKKAAEFVSEDQAREYFLELIRYISDTVRVVSFVLADDKAAYTIFETLNDRGLELAPLDLVKNYVFSRAELFRSGSLRDFEERWSEMMTLLGSMKVDSFLRAFWASRHGIMEGTKLFSAFKKTYNTPEKVHFISVELRRASEAYAAIASPSNPIWSRYSDEARHCIEALDVIGSSQMHPMILAALDRFSKHEMERLLRLLEVIAVRFQLVSRGRPGRIESLGAKVAREIWDRKITTANSVKIALSELYIADDDFKQLFRSKIETDGKKARYIFVGLERQSLLREGATYADELLPGNVTLEHIFPKSPQAFWKEEMAADAKLSRMLNRLGNMCLLPEVNRALGNKPWAEKLQAFAKSRLKTTNTIKQDTYPSWSSTAIEKRQSYMAELAVAAWRFP